MVSLEVVAILLSGISISASLFYYASVLKNQNETRQAQLYMQISNRYEDKHTASQWVWRNIEYKDFDDFWAKYGVDVNPDFWMRDSSIFTWYENVGVLVKEGMLNMRLVALSWAGASRMVWEKLEPILPQLRKQFNYPRMWSETEYLFRELIKYMKEHPELST